jgi:hypothetical protein
MVQDRYSDVRKATESYHYWLGVTAHARECVATGEASTSWLAFCLDQVASWRGHIASALRQEMQRPRREVA